MAVTQPSPIGPSDGGSTAGAASRPALVRLLAVPRRLRLRSLLDRRFTVRVRCAGACSVSARLQLDAASARRTGLTRRRGVAATIGRGIDLRTRATAFNLTIGLTPVAVRALRRLPRATLRVRIAGGGTTLEKSIAYVR